MQLKQIKCICFSATDTTRRYVEVLSREMGLPINLFINLADDLYAPLPLFSENDLLIIGSPVYGGRLPLQVAAAFARLRGNNAVAIALVVFGNRDYDDALLELSDILSDSGFRLIGAGAVVARHSIFPKVAALRPDETDLSNLREFAENCKSIIKKGIYGSIHVKGQRPYKKISGVKLPPMCDTLICNKCGLCAAKCPAGAISKDDFSFTEPTRCLACGRCIYVCPVKARSHAGFKYKLISAIFTSAFSHRKTPDFYYPI